MIAQTFTSRYFDVKCSLLSPEYIETAGEQNCRKIRGKPEPSESLCKGCPFVRYSFKSIIKANKTDER